MANIEHTFLETCSSLILLSLLVDITTYFRGFHGDVNETIFVGTPDEKSIRLVKSTYNCLAYSMDAGESTFGIKF